MTKEEIDKEHDELVKFVGTKVYSFFYPLVEVQQALVRMLQLNHEAHALKNKPKEVKIEEVKEPL